MHNKFEINRTKIKGGCQSGRKVVFHDSRSDLPLGKFFYILSNISDVVTTILCKLFFMLTRYLLTYDCVLGTS